MKTTTIPAQTTIILNTEEVKDAIRTYLEELEIEMPARIEVFHSGHGGTSIKWDVR